MRRMVDEELADRVCEARVVGIISDEMAVWAWCQIGCSRVDYILCVGD